MTIEEKLFKLINNYEFSFMLLEDFSEDSSEDKKFSACSAKMDFDFGHNGQWFESDSLTELIDMCWSTIGDTGVFRTRPRKRS